MIERVKMDNLQQNLGKVNIVCIVCLKLFPEGGIPGQVHPLAFTTPLTGTPSHGKVHPPAFTPPLAGTTSHEQVHPPWAVTTTGTGTPPCAYLPPVHLHLPGHIHPPGQIHLPVQLHPPGQLQPVADPGGAQWAMALQSPVKISHKKDFMILGLSLTGRWICQYADNTLGR